MDSERGYLRSQQYLDEMGKRTREWQTEFNSEMCKGLNRGKLNQSITCIFNGRNLEIVER